MPDAASLFEWKHGLPYIHGVLATYDQLVAALRLSQGFPDTRYVDRIFNAYMRQLWAMYVHPEAGHGLRHHALDKLILFGEVP